MTLLFATALVAQGIIPTGVIQTQDRPAGDVRITRAVFGAAQRSVDVTPVVTRLTQPGIDEFYTTPRWLEVDPAIGQTKNLVIFYEYRGAPHVLTTTELAAVSHAILIEHADPVLRPRPINTAAGVVIIHAYYGQGRNFQDVTTRANQIIRQADGPIVVSDSAMMVLPTTVTESLIITYSYRGTRNTWFAWSGGSVSYAALVAFAEAGGQSQRYSSVPPVWLAAADSARAAGADPNLGRAPRREVAITELLKAITEIEAIPARGRPERATNALAATRRALADAQVNIGYLYPPANSPRPEAPDASIAIHISNAVQSVTTAVEQLSGASPGRGRANATLNRTIAAINEALAALR